MSEEGDQSSIAARFARIESAYTFHEVTGLEAVPVSDLPIFVRLGKRVAADTVVVVNRADDLLASEQGSRTITGTGRSLDPSVQTLIIEPNSYDVDQDEGFKVLHDGEDVTLGRAPENQLSSSQPFSEYVSYNHALIQKTGDGQWVIVRDLGSTNGTFLGKLARNLFEEELTTTDPITDDTQYETESPLSRYAYGASIASEMHPDRNEDRLYIDDAHDIYAVFDGIGGYVGGEVASEAAKNSVASKARIPVSFSTAEAAEMYLKGILFAANDAVLRSAPDAGTTAVVAKLYQIDSSTYASIAHVGDSRAYLLRGGILKALTTDHTPFRNAAGTDRAMEQQERLAETESVNILSQDDIQAFRQRNIISTCLGLGTSLESDVKHFAVQPGDTLILTTDGIHDNLTTKEMQRLLMDGENLNHAELLIAAAHKRAQEMHDRAKMDDMTAVVIRI